jgi:hypothetical protein
MLLRPGERETLQLSSSPASLPLIHIGLLLMQDGFSLLHTAVIGKKEAAI